MVKRKLKFNLRTRLVSSMRLVWLKSPQRYSVLKAARVDRGLYQCNKCRGVFKQKEIQIDHLVPIKKGKNIHDWNDYIKNLFEGDMQALCKPCHKEKTISGL